MKDTVIIRTEDLTKTYGTKTAVNHLSLEIRRGEIFGLLGPNGAGKTTTILMLLGLTEPTQGRALIDGMTVPDSPCRSSGLPDICRIMSGFTAI